MCSCITLWNANVRIRHKMCRNYDSLTVLKFNTRSISCWHCHRICSICPLLTCVQAYRCVCHSLIARKVFYPSAGQHSPTQHPQHCLISGAYNTRVYITSLDQISQTSIWWHKLHVALSIACLPAVCSKCRWTEEVSAGPLEKHGMYYWQCNNNK